MGVVYTACPEGGVKGLPLGVGLEPPQLSQMVQALGPGGNEDGAICRPGVQITPPSILLLASVSQSTPRLTPAPSRRNWRQERINQ